MAKKNEQEKSYNACARPEGHRDHMCNLMERGQTAEVAQRSTRPAFFCGNCGARANEREDLCSPAPLRKS